MSQGEMKGLIMDSGISKDITERDIGLCFSLSMMTQVDELKANRVWEMSFVEYLELLGRLADKISLCSLYYGEDEIPEVPKAEREAQPLCLKVEALLVRFMKTIVPWDKVMKYYTIPTDSSFSKTGKILEYENW
jgi:hypothetical protein